MDRVTWVAQISGAMVAAIGSTFGFDGVATSGELAGQSLELVPATVEYRHAFEYFSDAEIYQGEAPTS